MNPLSHLIDWLRRPPTGTFADGSPRRYQQAVELTYVETQSHEGRVGTPGVAELRRGQGDKPHNQDRAC